MTIRCILLGVSWVLPSALVWRPCRKWRWGSLWVHDPTCYRHAQPPELDSPQGAEMNVLECLSAPPTYKLWEWVVTRINHLACLQNYSFCATRIWYLEGTQMFGECRRPMHWRLEGRGCEEHLCGLRPLIPPPVFCPHHALLQNFTEEE